VTTWRRDGLEHEIPAYGAVVFFFDVFTVIVHGSVVGRVPYLSTFDHKINK
jgi:hypothetical protein